MKNISFPGSVIYNDLGVEHLYTSAPLFLCVFM